MGLGPATAAPSSLDAFLTVTVALKSRSAGRACQRVAAGRRAFAIPAFVITPSARICRHDRCEITGSGYGLCSARLVRPLGSERGVFSDSYPATGLHSARLGCGGGSLGPLRDRMALLFSHHGHDADRQSIGIRHVGRPR
jgi:hypothetical protein